MRRSTLITILVVVLVVGVVGGVGLWNFGRNQSWWGTSDAQRELSADPMAAPDLAGLTLVRSDQREPVGFMGKSRGAKVEHWFTPRLESSAQVADLGRLAVSHGWSVEASKSNELTWVGARQMRSGEASLVITAEPTIVRAGGEDLVGTIGVCLSL